MAENEQAGGNNLDDFFAKKDKSKKKTKSSKFTVDDILQAKAESEEKSKKVRSSKKKEKDANRSGDKQLGVKPEGVMFTSVYVGFIWSSRREMQKQIGPAQLDAGILRNADCGMRKVVKG